MDTDCGPQQPTQGAILYLIIILWDSCGLRNIYCTARSGDSELGQSIIKKNSSNVTILIQFHISQSEEARHINLFTSIYVVLVCGEVYGIRCNI